MKVSLQFLERAAVETGFPAQTLEKVICLGSMADAVSRLGYRVQRSLSDA